MNNEEKMRAEFESKAKIHYSIERREDGFYERCDTECAYKGWIAAAKFYMTDASAREDEGSQNASSDDRTTSVANSGVRTYSARSEKTKHAQVGQSSDAIASIDCSPAKLIAEIEGLRRDKVYCLENAIIDKVLTIIRNHYASLSTANADTGIDMDDIHDKYVVKLRSGGEYTAKACLEGFYLIHEDSSAEHLRRDNWKNYWHQNGKSKEGSNYDIVKIFKQCGALRVKGGLEDVSNQ